MNIKQYLDKEGIPKKDWATIKGEIFGSLSREDKQRFEDSLLQYRKVPFIFENQQSYYTTISEIKLKSYFSFCNFNICRAI